MSECSVCLVEHDEATHAATVSIHGWLKRRLSRVLSAEPEVEPPPPSPPPQQPIAIDPGRWRRKGERHVRNKKRDQH
jgi:hypothetical protein